MDEGAVTDDAHDAPGLIRRKHVAAAPARRPGWPPADARVDGLERLKHAKRVAYLHDVAHRATEQSHVLSAASRSRCGKKVAECVVAAGDTGCYTLGVLQPFETIDSCVCMGASLGVGLGLRHVLPPDQARRVVSVIGDSTFVH